MDEVRIGVFVCHCGTNIGGFVDVPAVTEYAKRLPGVVYTEHNLYTCADDGLRAIKTAITKYQLTRVIVAACTPRTHAPLFRSACRDAGLNPYLFEFVNIRDQCSWVHMNEKEKATEKAKDLIRMGVAKAALLQPDENVSVDVLPSALVIGGGISGMSVALSLANQGFPVCIVEKEKELGGMLRGLHTLFPSGRKAAEVLQPLLDEVRSHEKITVLESSRVQDLKGFIGNFDLAINRNGEEIPVKAGTIIVATGAGAFRPDGLYRYGESDRVITQFELEGRLNRGYTPPENLVMIQCAGSRGQSFSYCSRICCMVAMKNAILLKEMNPDAEISILHHDIQVYGGGYEPLYRKARESGVRFIPFSPERPPTVGDRVCSVHDPVLRRELEIPADLVVLSTPLVQNQDAEELSQTLKVPLGQDRFFFEAHVKLRPVDFANDGIYVCGTARGPASIPESVEQALATASRAGIPLWNGFFETEAISSIIDPSLCTGCGVCESLCPYRAIRIENTVAYSITALCKGCGNCGAACPTHAITMSHFTDQQIHAEIEAAFEERRSGETKIIVFCCNWCSYAGADFAGVARFQYPPYTRIIRVMCSARVDPVFVFDALLQGADGVLISGCHLQDCHYIDGNLETLRRYDLLHAIFERFGIDKRIRLEWVAASEGEKFSEITKEFVDQIRSLGPVDSQDLQSLLYLKQVFGGKKLRLMLGLARKSIQKGVPEGQYTDRLYNTVIKEFEAVKREDEKTRQLREKTRTISGALSSDLLAAGDPLVISGSTTGPVPPEIGIWILGEEFRLFDRIPADGDAFRYIVPAERTGLMKPGEYTVILQHPGENDRLDLTGRVEGSGIDIMTPDGQALTTIPGLEVVLQAEYLLSDLITANGLDDIVVALPLIVQEPFIRIEPVPDKEMGDSVTISGFTNISPGEEFSVIISPIRDARKRYYQVDDIILKAQVRTGHGGENPWSADPACTLPYAQDYRIQVSSKGGINAVGRVSVKWRME